MEHNSDIVSLGRLVHEESYKRNKKEVSFDNMKADFVKKGDKVEIHEVKKSMKWPKSHKFQLLYYLYNLEQKGIKSEGVLDYPNERKREKVFLDEKSRKELEEVIEDIKRIVSSSKPPEKCTCNSKSAYFELCRI